MPEQENWENQKTVAGWLFKGAVLLIVIMLAIYVVLMGSITNKEKLREDSGMVRLDLTLIPMTQQEIPSYGKIRRFYDFSITGDVAKRDDLGIWLVHAYAEVYINGNLVYSCRESKTDHIGHSPGCYWIFLPLEEADYGKNLRIIVTPAYREVANREPVIYAGRRDVIAGTLLLEEAAIVCVALLCIIVGVIFMILSTSMLRETNEQRVVLYMGLLLFLAGGMEIYGYTVHLCHDGTV